jgi:hypothetical protein
MRANFITATTSALVALALLAGSSVQAADLTSPSNICIPLQPATLLQIESNTELTQTVVDIMNEAVSVSEDPRVINDRSQSYVWASETKIACGKAYGYLQSNYRDEQNLNKCECFFRRMQHYIY